MARLRLIAVILLLVINIYLTSCAEESPETSTLQAFIENISSTSKSINFKYEQQFMQCMKEMCPISKFNSVKPHKIHIALLLPSSPPKDQVTTQTLSAILPVIELAIQNVKHEKLLNDIELVVHPRDTKCSSTDGPLEAFELHYREEADVFLGPICDYVLAPVARYASKWETSVISTSGLAAAFNYKHPQFSTLTRMLSYSEMTNAVTKIVKHFEWEIFGFFFHNYNDASKGYSSCHHILAPIHKHHNNATNYRETFDEVTDKDLKEKLERLKEKSRIVIMCANSQTIRKIMIAAEELNMIDSGEYVFFNIEIFGSMKKDLRPWFDEKDAENDRNIKAEKAYQALLTITARKPEDEEYQSFSDKVKVLAKEKYNYTFVEDEPISQFVSAFHDAVLLFAHALNHSIQEKGQNALIKPLNGTSLTQLMWGTHFKGITGDVSIDDNGDRLSDYSLLDMNPITNHFEIVANYSHKDGLRLIKGKSIHWAGGRNSPPADKPKCGFDNSLCPEDSSTMFAMLSLILGLVVIVMTIVSFISYRHYKIEAEISSMTWKITWNEVIPMPTSNNIRGSIHSRAGSQISGFSEEYMADKQIFIPIGTYKGNTCAIKKINVPINLNRSLMMELKTMKDLQNDHLVRFYGAVIDSIPSILTEYCPKGSLQDILENHEINLDMMFKLSLMHDIVKGMHFLHTTSIHSHGQLKSSNCVVDSRFVCKISDYGLHELRKSPNEENEMKNSHEFWKKFLWTAPELLRSDQNADKGTQKGDVYSYGIIIQEICCRQGVFYLGDRCLEKEPKEIIQLVTSCPIYPNEPFRPAIDDSKDSCCDVNNLMMKCWAEDPMDRPDFYQIKSMIRKINKENESGNILDNLLKRMEHYAQNLESLVDERTRDYLEEKKKCETLLYQLLPVSIASQLIEGQSVIAEMYDAVTIYFSDIVGFTSISAESTPMQVVDLLNDLYTCFDKIVGHFDVYKVETIGDAYMVVSGLPVRNGDLHAREIARMALALLEKVHNFKIKHRPNDTLKLRIGIHSGPACAGVVGLKMPRYCLFGDTVNTASRMESNGEALKIHISHSTKQILDKIGTFDMTSRGFVTMKGKGDMMTYWLNGEKSPEDISPQKLSSLPSLPAIGVNNHNLHINGIDSNGSTREVKFLENNNHTPTDTNDKPNPKAIAVVPPLTPQNSFNSKKSFMMNNSSLLRSNHSSCGSLKDISLQPLINGKKPVIFKRKQINFANEKLQPLISSVAK